MERRTAVMFTVLSLVFLVYALTGGLSGCPSSNLGDAKIFQDIGSRYSDPPSSPGDDGPIRINPF